MCIYIWYVLINIIECPLSPISPVPSAKQHSTIGPVHATQLGRDVLAGLEAIHQGVQVAQEVCPSHRGNDGEIWGMYWMYSMHPQSQDEANVSSIFGIFMEIRNHHFMAIYKDFFELKWEIDDQPWDGRGTPFLDKPNWLSHAAAGCLDSL